MLRYLLTVAVWAAIGYPIYHFIAPWALVVYGVASMVGLLVWAATRKPNI